MSLAVNWSNAKITEQNPIGLHGVDFIEYSGSDATYFENLFTKLGFQQVGKAGSKNIKLFRQGDINFILNFEPNTFAVNFAKAHGPCACATGFRVANAQKAFEAALKRGARAYDGSQESRGASPYLAVYGIGDSLIYFIDEANYKDLYENQFKIANNKDFFPEGLGLRYVDHFTNNVPVGEMQKWCDFYQKVFAFTEVRYFDIKGKTTGLISKVMKSPCGRFSVPINEPSDGKSQIQEYLDEYKGSGIQHIALITNEIIGTLEKLKSNKVEFLAAPPDTYYQQLKTRLPQVSEDISRVQKNAILIDGDQSGYLLQIFSKNVIGPIFYEVIQRKGHKGFGEGNFQALFDAIEADQKARGYL
ncbi:MAG: 4-hydroxyphenylpyruvate dioxygenase [Pseudobdellovibrio sp.]